MALNDITVVRGQNGLGRPLAGEDFISALMFYTTNATLPSGFSTSARIKQVLSVAQAEALGIVNTYSDETKATSTILFTAAGATGDTINIKYQEPINNVNLGTYTRTSTDTTPTLVATAVKNMINAGTPTHGYTATSNTATVTIIARPGLGIFPNTGTVVTTTIVGTIAITTTQSVIAGVASLLAIWHYHIKEYFRIQPNGNLYVNFIDSNANAYDFAEILTLQDFALGKIRNVGIYLGNSGTATAAIIGTYATALQTKCNLLEGYHTPVSCVIATDITGISDLTTLIDLSALTNRSVSVTIGQDYQGLGWALWKAVGKTISNLGAILGAISLSKVNESIAWVAKFNLTDGIEMAIAGYGNGAQVNMIADVNLLSQLQTYRYIFLRYFQGKSGTFVNDNTCAISPTSDYAFINDNRTIDKVDRNVYAAYLDYLSSPLLLNSDGTLTDTDVAALTGTGETVMDTMVRDQEMSAYEVLVDPAQDVLATSKLVVSVRILPAGVARNITINTQYVTAI